MILNKIDLLPHVSFDVERCIDYAQRINPNIEVLQLAATTGEGLTNWCDWPGCTTAAGRHRCGDDHIGGC